MKVREIMTSNPVTCAPDDHLGTAAWLMFEGDCGVLPVTRGESVVGVITDRDIAVSLGLRGHRPTDLLVGEVMQGCDGVVTCDPEDSPAKALKLMSDRQIRRLPVIENGSLVGMVSLNDLALVAGATADSAGRPTYREVARALQGVCAHRAQIQAA